MADSEAEAAPAPGGGAMVYDSSGRFAIHAAPNAAHSMPQRRRSAPYTTATSDTANQGKMAEAIRSLNFAPITDVRLATCETSGG